MAAELTGRRILVAEDQLILALDLERVLGEFGCLVVGPLPRLREVMDRIEENSFDAAILDLNLAGEQSWPAADALERRGIPFVLATGYGEITLPERFRDRPYLQKPFDAGGLRHALSQALGL